MDALLDLQALAGIAAFIALALPFSSRIASIRWRLVAVAVALQFAICFVLLRVPPISAALSSLNRLVAALSDATRQGTAFVFGYAGGAPPPFVITRPAALAVFAFQVIPIILVVSALSAVLWYWRVLPVVIRGIAWIFERTLGTRGPAGFAVTANVFVGQVEAPLLVRPYIARMTRYELLLLMTAGMAMIAGSMMVVYAAMLASHFDNMLSQLLTKSLMSIPASILFAYLMLPDDAQSADHAEPGRIYTSTMDAVTRGTADGLHIWLNVIAILIVLIALVALVNMGVAALPDVGGAPLSLERIVGWLFAPLAWLMGIPWSEAPQAGSLLGIKTVLNEFLAYLKLAELGRGALSDRTRLIAIYALCGFANFASMGIQISGIAAMAPERRADLNELALRSLVGATLASCMTGAIVGIVAF
ncbi:MAG TPA: nucleoside transporter C-terminal domain-containing protein [Steroidobacteraceae bacterium]|nr:nucleoside transporter C-terminal domain-containing protein [Steroidobacteraceae bacterium]